MAKFWDSLGQVAVRVGLAEPAQEQAVSAPSPSAAAPASHAAATSPAPPAADQARLAELDKMARDRLVAAMQNDGAPLVEDLADHLETLAEAIPDEKARYLSALKLLAKKGGVTVAILSDFDKCLGSLDETSRGFESDCAAQLEAKVGTRVHEIEGHDAQIKTKSTQIETLHAQVEAIRTEIAELTKKKAETQAGIAVKQAEIAQVRDRFAGVYKTVRGQIEEQRAKVATYGQGH